MVREDGPLEGRVALPVVGRDVDDHALHRRPRVVARTARGVADVGVWNHDGATVGIQEHLGRVEPHAVQRIERALDPIRVELPGLHVGTKMCQ